MAITFDAHSNGGDGSATTPKTWTHTNGAGASYLLVSIVVAAGGDCVTGVTYNSVAMTQCNKVIEGNGTSLYVYGLVNPAAGANTVSVAFSGAPVWVDGVGDSYIGTETSTSTPDTTGTFADPADGTTFTVSTGSTTTANNCIIFVAAETGGADNYVSGLGNHRGTNNYANPWVGDTLTPIASGSTGSASITISSGNRRNAIIVALAPAVTSLFTKNIKTMSQAINRASTY